MYIFTKFHKDWTIIVDFLIIEKLLASPDNYASHPLFEYINSIGHLYSTLTETTLFLTQAYGLVQLIYSCLFLPRLDFKTTICMYANHACLLPLN